MRGIDVSKEEIAAAKSFLEVSQKVVFPDDEQRIIISRCELLRLIAWYGSIRSEGRPLKSGQFYNVDEEKRQKRKGLAVMPKAVPNE